MTRSKDHPYYLKIEQAIKPHLYKYEEPWLNRDPMIQDILDALFREPYNVTNWRDEELQKLRDEYDGKHNKEHDEEVVPI
tara:strand:+ start:1880 stop:2119 length:240 start_codon:yes stop_codon:yes gene_type:complete